MRTLKFYSQPTNAFFADVNQMFGGSSQLPTTAERAVIKSLCTVQSTKQCSAGVVSWEDPPNISLTATRNAFVGRSSKFRVRMLFKNAVNIITVIWFFKPAAFTQNEKVRSWSRDQNLIFKIMNYHTAF